MSFQAFRESDWSILNAFYLKIISQHFDILMFVNFCIEIFSGICLTIDTIAISGFTFDIYKSNNYIIIIIYKNIIIIIL